MTGIIERYVINNHRALHIGLRGLLTLVMFIAFVTATALTGLSSGDYALVLSYTLIIYGFIWTYSAVKRGSNVQILAHGNQVTFDFVILIALIVAAVVLSGSMWGRLCNIAVNCSAFQACITVLYIGVAVQVLMLLVLCFGRSAEGSQSPDSATIETPRTEYQHAADAT
ncbi:hypothetical protein DYB32_003069 [Aphanomyces invadans]|uniref:MARVEL domain-containing protein n=1 Tax=Aphanomyces invadans TaxID=157072 RepID=A0A418B1K1_9STRA|nr:hypothetical protein DYB32_003069 [Aphanomyces invadans]